MEDSSVLFNLREIMKLEHERIDAEASAVRAAREREARQREERERAAQEQRERVQRALLEQERAQAAAAAEAERERAEAMLRVRLEHEARERELREQAERAHARELHALDRKRSGRLLLVALAAALVTCAAGFGALAPRWRAAATQRAELERRAASEASELDALRRELSELRERSAAASAPPTVPTPVPGAPEGTDSARARPDPSSARPVRVPAAPKPGSATRPQARAADALDGMENPTDDPIGELFEEREPAPRRRRR